MNFVHLIIALMGAAWTFVCRRVDRAVIALEMAYISFRRWAARDHALKPVLNSGAFWTTGSGERP
ncbi:hypothetical protein [Streptomyces sp. NPDC087317]|uniref:hypothetical protein n=1 Tax=Streptomyces sp. NPDC087317 TaxID=3365784 RepID=UPI00382ADD85